MLSKNWNELIKPAKVEVEHISEKEIKMIAEPLERGFGITIGNSLRRALFSLQGSAVTKIKIDGIMHEFSPIPGAKEDIIDIILNIKSLAIRKDSTDTKKLILNVFGPCVVTAAMIETGHGVEIINKDLVICTLEKNANLNMELYCESGKGYVPAGQSPAGHNDQLGMISIDAIFSPIKKAFYKIENSRVGQVTDFDKLIFSIETNGTLSPEMALGLAARILQDQLKLFINFEDEPEVRKAEEKALDFDPRLLKKVLEVELSVRSHNCLRNANIIYIGDLVQQTEGEMLRTPNFGRKSLNEIKAMLATMGLKFNMDVPNWPPENIEELSKKQEEPF